MASLISPPELQYITEALLAGKRSDGRSLLQFRDIHLATSVIALTSGSARVSCAGTDVIVGIKLETGSIDSDERLQVTVELAQSALQALPADPTSDLTSHAYHLVSPLLRHPQLSIIPGSKCWHLQLHVTILATNGGGNLHDIMSIAIRGALYDLKIPRTRPITFVGSNKQRNAANEEEEENVGGMAALLKGGKGGKPQTDEQTAAPDFELLDYEADTGLPLKDRDDLPVTVTLFITPTTYQPFIDATMFESFAAPTRLLCTFSGSSNGEMIALKQDIPDGYASDAPNELPFDKVNDVLETAADIARKLVVVLNARLKDKQSSQAGVRLGAFP